LPTLWYLVSWLSVSCHMTFNLDWFMEYLPLPNNKHVFSGDDIVKWAIGEGTIAIQITTQITTNHIVEVKNVLHMPRFTKKILFVRQSTQKGGRISFYHKFCIIELYTPSNDWITFKCAQFDNLYLLAHALRLIQLQAWLLPCKIPLAHKH